jgi:hypothetical protein
MSSDFWGQPHGMSSGYSSSVQLQTQSHSCMPLFESPMTLLHTCPFRLQAHGTGHLPSEVLSASPVLMVLIVCYFCCVNTVIDSPSVMLLTRTPHV